jgi:hypothetical protein
MTETVATQTPRVAVASAVIHNAKQTRLAAAVLFVRERVFVLNMFVLSFEFVSDFVLRIWDFESCALRARVL